MRDFYKGDRIKIDIDRLRKSEIEFKQDASIFVYDIIEVDDELLVVTDIRNNEDEELEIYLVSAGITKAIEIK